MVRVGVIDAFGSVNGGTGSTAWCIPITLVRGNRWSALILILVPQRSIADEGTRTLDFLRRQAMQAVLTHLLLADAEAGESLSLLWDLDLFVLG